MSNKPTTWDHAMAALGGPERVKDKIYGALRTGSRAKGNDYHDGMDRRLGGGPSAIDFHRRGPHMNEIDFDVSDDEPAQAAPRAGSMQRMPPPRPGSRPPGYTPGVSDPNSPMRGRMMGRRPMVKREGEGLEGCAACGEMHQENAGCYESVDLAEATPFGGPNSGAPGKPLTGQTSTGSGRSMRSRTKTLQMTAPGQVQLQPGERAFVANVPGVGDYNVPARDESEARNRIVDLMKDWGREIQPDQVMVTQSESSGGGVAGFQMPIGASEKMDELRDMVRRSLAEVVRKKEGGGGYVLYAPNKGKKKSAKPAGEFPTRLAAKRAELARFPPKDSEQLKKMRKRIDKLTKDPKKRADAERKELSGRKPVKKSRKPSGARRKPTREALVREMARGINERLFRDEEIAGSPWDQRIANLSPDAIAQDKRLAALHKKMHQNSSWSLEDAHKGFAKVLKGIAKVLPGEISFDDNRQKMYCPCMLDVDGTELGPIHFYIDGGLVKCEVSQEARQALAEMDPVIGRDLRGSLMTYQEDHLPKITYAKDAWDERDSYLDKLHQRLDKSLGGMSPVEVHLAKQLIGRRRK